MSLNAILSLVLDTPLVYLGNPSSFSVAIVHPTLAIVIVLYTPQCILLLTLFTRTLQYEQSQRVSMHIIIFTAIIVAKS